MDPLHITEFASDQFYNKLKQQSETRTQQAQPQPQVLPPPQQPLLLQPLAAPHQQDHVVASSSVVAPAPIPIPIHESQFILPLGQPRPSRDEPVAPIEIKVVEPKKEKRGFLRGLLATRTPSSTSDFLAPRKTSVDEAINRRRSVSFDELLLALPNELLVEIIAALPLSDVLNLRLVSRQWHQLISLNEGPIVRHHLEFNIPAYAKRLYVPPEPSQVSFHYICGLWHRLHVAAKLSHFICEWTVKDIFLKKTDDARAEFAEQTERIRRRLVPLVFTIFHFLESHRDIYLRRLRETGGVGLSKEAYTLNPIEAEIFSKYDDQTLLRVHEVFPMVVASFLRRLRPPTYVGRVEKTMRGYIKDPPKPEVSVALLCIGGLRQVERIWAIKGYNARIAAVEKWYADLTSDLPAIDPQVQPKARKSVLPLLHRKKSSHAIREHHQVHTTPPAAPPLPPMPLRQVNMNGPAVNFSYPRLVNKPLPPPPNLIFHTSLARGMPMAPLSQEQNRLLLSELPVLRDLWLRTGEATLLDRGVVERASDIKRNAAVMLALINQEGLAEEDQWWYGQRQPDSVRPTGDGADEEI